MIKDIIDNMIIESDFRVVKFTFIRMDAWSYESFLVEFSRELKTHISSVREYKGLKVRIDGTKNVLIEIG